MGKAKQHLNKLRKIKEEMMELKNSIKNVNQHEDVLNVYNEVIEVWKSYLFEDEKERHIGNEDNENAIHELESSINETFENIQQYIERRYRSIFETTEKINAAYDLECCENEIEELKKTLAASQNKHQQDRNELYKIKGELFNARQQIDNLNKKLLSKQPPGERKTHELIEKGTALVQCENKKLYYELMEVKKEQQRESQQHEKIMNKQWNTLKRMHKEMNNKLNNLMDGIDDQQTERPKMENRISCHVGYRITDSNQILLHAINGLKLNPDENESSKPTL